jgi:ABC-type glycerol-3-phosphate transport system substrate-binding protein
MAHHVKRGLCMAILAAALAASGCSRRGCCVTGRFDVPITTHHADGAEAATPEEAAAPTGAVRVEPPPVIDGPMPRMPR